MQGAASSISTGGEVTDLLMCVARRALASHRREQVFDPFPRIPDPTSGAADKLWLDPCRAPIDEKRWRTLHEIFEMVPSVESMMSTARSQRELMEIMDARSPLCYPLLDWVVTSNRSHIVALTAARRIECMKTPHQYLLVTAAPEAEERFQRMKAQHGSYFAFHGSPPENWHRILRHGLKNLSGSKLQLHGAAHGAGVYVSTDLQVAMRYVESGGRTQQMASFARPTNGGRTSCCATARPTPSPACRGTSSATSS